MSLELDIVTKLNERLNEMEASELARLPRALPFETYHQACAYLQFVRDFRDTIIPQVVEEIQKR